MKGKRVQFDAETWLALDTLARDSRRSFDDLAAEAFADLLRKHGRPTSLSEALRESARHAPANTPFGGVGAEEAPLKTVAKRAPIARPRKRR